MELPRDDRVTTGFLGMSHMGQVAAACWAYRVGLVLEVGERTPLTKPEPRLELLMANPRTTDLSRLRECSMVIVSQDVPLGADGRGDESAIRSLIEEALPYIASTVFLVIMSQVSPGFTRSIHELRLSKGGVPVFYWVETMVLGQAVERFLHPERIILGSVVPDAPLPWLVEDAVKQFKCPVLVMKYESAELCKMAINTCLASSIAAATTLADLGERIGAEWDEIMPALRLDKRIGQHAYIKPNPGLIGGQHLIRDLLALKRIGTEHGAETDFLDHLLPRVAVR